MAPPTMALHLPWHYLLTTDYIWQVRVSQLLATLRQTPHNGFPIVGCKLETMHHVSGLILRQQLEVILELRLWGSRSGKETPLADDVRLRYISAITMADTPMRIDPSYPTRRGSMEVTTLAATLTPSL